MTNLSIQFLFRSIITASLTLVTLGVVSDAGAQRLDPSRRGAIPPQYQGEIRPAQFEPTSTRIDLPTATYESSVPLAQATDSYIPTTDAMMPSYDAPISRSPQAGSQNRAIPSYPNDYPVGNGEILVDPNTYRQDGQYHDGSQGTAPVYSSGSWYMRGDWYFQADAVWLNRDVSGDVFLATDASLGNFRTLDQLISLDFAPGVRASIGRFLGRDAGNRDYMLDLSYLGGFNWDETATLISRDGNGLNTLLNTSSDRNDITDVFFGNDQQEFQYEVDLNSLELNCRVRTRPGRDQLAMQPDGRWVRHGVVSQMRSMFAGFRFVSLNEHFRVDATANGSVSETTTTSIFNGEQTTVISDEIPDFNRGRFAVKTENSMFGFQMGGELTEKHDDWTWGVRGKVGGLINFANRRSYLTANQRDPQTATTMTPAFNDDGDPIYVETIIDPNTGNETTQFTTENPTGTLPRAMDTVVTTTYESVVSSMTDGRDKDKMTFLGEAGIFGTYQVRPNLHFKASYDVLVLSGVAFAPKNAGLVNGFSNFNVGSTSFMHGGSLGFESTW